MPFAVSSPRVASRNRTRMSKEKEASENRKRSTFGVVFLIIFLDMVGFSVIFPLFPDMLNHYSTEKSKKAGDLKDFVSLINGMGFDQEGGNNFCVLKQLFSVVCSARFMQSCSFFRPVWGRLSDSSDAGRSCCYKSGIARLLLWVLREAFGYLCFQ